MCQLPGSGENHTAYIYKRANTPRKVSTKDNKIIIPKREGYDESDEEVVCDKLFEEAALLAVGDIAHLYDHVKAISSDHLCERRPTRVRKPAVK